MCHEPRFKAGTAPLELIKARGMCFLSERADRNSDISICCTLCYSNSSLAQYFLTNRLKNQPQTGFNASSKEPSNYGFSFNFWVILEIWVATPLKTVPISESILSTLCNALSRVDLTISSSDSMPFSLP